MDKYTLINRAYELFSDFDEPLKYTIHYNCPECDDHEAVLRGLDRETLSGSDFGTAVYTPLWNMTAEAIAYFLPRIIELALNNETDADNTPILIRFINLSADGPKADRFELLSDEQVACISDVLLYIKSHHRDIVECECWSDELNSAINNWHTNHG
ncbi:hypothetical protein [Candidatus Magnetobacterium casense]|uniref:hypothetical protein n=1 Tax=Candidatus Magnetobacterium casense TaxID=1455061 RepID=UPI00058BA405|nr:hypothetical protein [Candidatus Magnetobacterium casensis]